MGTNRHLKSQLRLGNHLGSLNTAENPAKQGAVIVLFVTGEGLTDPAGVEGHIIGDILPTPKLPLVALIPWTHRGDCFVEVVSASGVRGSVPGLLEVKLRVPYKRCKVAQFRCLCGTGPLFSAGCNARHLIGSEAVAVQSGSSAIPQLRLWLEKWRYRNVPARRHGFRWWVTHPDEGC